MTIQYIYNVGDIVKIKSGGPEMTVQAVPSEHNEYYRCQWFAGKKLEFGVFPEDSLENVVQEVS